MPIRNQYNAGYNGLNAAGKAEVSALDADMKTKTKAWNDWFAAKAAGAAAGAGAGAGAVDPVTALVTAATRAAVPANITEAINNANRDAIALVAAPANVALRATALASYNAANALVNPAGVDATARTALNAVMTKLNTVAGVTIAGTADMAGGRRRGRKSRKSRKATKKSTKKSKATKKAKKSRKSKGRK
jgi:hypothetical protein